MSWWDVCSSFGAIWCMMISESWCVCVAAYLLYLSFPDCLIVCHMTFNKTTLSLACDYFWTWLPECMSHDFLKITSSSQCHMTILFVWGFLTFIGFSLCHMTYWLPTGCCGTLPVRCHLKAPSQLWCCIWIWLVDLHVWFFTVMCVVHLVAWPSWLTGYDIPLSDMIIYQLSGVSSPTF